MGGNISPNDANTMQRIISRFMIISPHINSLIYSDQSRMVGSPLILMLVNTPALRDAISEKAEGFYRQNRKSHQPHLVGGHGNERPTSKGGLPTTRDELRLA